MAKNIKLGAIQIAGWNPKDKKMFSWDFYYNKKDQFYEDSYGRDVKKCDPDEVVLPPDKEYTLIIDYPTSVSYKAKIKTGKKGLTRLQLADKICKHYRKMYDNDEKYGIWGHGIGDLVLVDACIHKNGEITLGVDS